MRRATCQDCNAVVHLADRGPAPLRCDDCRKTNHARIMRAQRADHRAEVAQLRAKVQHYEAALAA